jgi:hypothetical protein
VEVLSGSRFLQVGDQTVSVLLLLQTSKHHLGAWDVLLGVGQVDVKGVWTPCNTLILVGLGVGEVGGLSCLSSEKPIQVGTLFVFASLLHGVALGARFCEDLLSGLCRHLTLAPASLK